MPLPRNLRAGGEFGPLFIPRGGAFRRFESNPSDPVGRCTVFAKQRDAPARVRASLYVFARD